MKSEKFCIFAAMNDEKKISVVINTRNAEQHLQQVLEAVKGFDEVLICDMESEDHTLDIARQYGCRIVTFERKNYNIVEPAREFAIHEARYDWVLVVDADEVVTPELKDYLYSRIKEVNCPDGLYIPRKNYFMGRFMRCHYPDHILRFFRKDKTHWPAIIHCVPEVDGRIEKIPAKHIELAFEHLANESVESIVNKTGQYTRNELERKQQKQYGVRTILWRPAWRFFRNYILKLGFRDGLPGLIRAGMDAFYQFVLVAKVIEKNKRLNKE